MDGDGFQSMLQHTFSGGDRRRAADQMDRDLGGDFITFFHLMKADGHEAAGDRVALQVVEHDRVLGFIALDGQINDRVYTRPGGQNGDQGAGRHIYTHWLQAFTVDRPGDQA